VPIGEITNTANAVLITPQHWVFLDLQWPRGKGTNVEPIRKCGFDIYIFWMKRMHAEGPPKRKCRKQSIKQIQLHNSLSAVIHVLGQILR
jgi:hypothetical protein